MRQLRALFFTVACVVGAVLGTAGATHAEPPLSTKTVAAPARGLHTEPAGETATTAPPDPSEFADSDAVEAARPAVGSAGEPMAEPVGGPLVSAGPVAVPTLHRTPMMATAVRHIPTASQPASPDELDPIADKAMVLLVGWTMLVLLGGGACVGRRTHR